ncbi:MAG: hypothetical protein LBC42_00715 [Puniceicoccales bacterium]|jgi:hypothetical protein|nr:hypothetical protein [Puniceicoccales bacterium]
MDEKLGTDEKIEWCIAILDESYNWWLDDASWLPETIEEERLSILDPRQIEYVFDLLEQLRDFGLQHSIVERAFLRFAIDRDLGGGRVRLVATREQIAESEEKLFALPNIFSDTYGGYAEFLDHISSLRIKYLNSAHHFAQQLTVDELEDEVRESLEGNAETHEAVHLFQELAGILEYCPAGYVERDESETEEMLHADDDLPDEVAIAENH